MDWLIWVIVIILIVAVVWWLLNRNSRGSAMASDRPGASAAQTESVRGQSAAPAAAATPAAPEPAAPAPVTSATASTSPAPTPAAAASASVRETESSGSSAYPAPSEPTASAASSDPGAENQGPAAAAAPTDADWAEAPAPDGGDVDDWDTDVEPSRTHSASAAAAEARTAKDEAEDADKAEWEAQWSEGSTSAPGQSMPAPAEHRHDDLHHEYTGEHAPTLPGAESAAAESADEESASSEGAPSETAETGPAAAHTPVPAAALDPDEETLQRAESSAVTESSLSHTAEPSGHLAAEQPYGEGSASAAADGSGPEGYTVKGDAETMTYFEETNPAYEDAPAGVWFESVAHAEAAGFRPPRRTRL